MHNAPVGDVSTDRRSILGFLADRANVLTLSGLLCGVIGIYFAVKGSFSEAMIAMLWAVFFDWFDGPVARRTPGRTSEDRAFGGQLDSLVDIVSSAVCPAIVLLSIGEFSVWFMPGAFALIMAGAMRLSYFNVFGLEDDSSYRGLPTDHNIILFSIAFVFYGYLSQDSFRVVLYVITLGLACLNVASFRMPKVGGAWYLGFVGFVVGMTVLYAGRMLGQWG